MLKRICCFLTVLLLLGSSLPVFAEETDTIAEPTLSPDADKYDSEHPQLLEEDQLYAQAAVLIQENSGEIIFNKNAEQIMYPASTTKIMTVLLALMSIDDIDEMVTVSEAAVDVPADSSTMGLSAGEQISLRDVLYGTMMISGNDGANVIAEAVSGSISAFVDYMNQAAQIFGCRNTHFMNPHGYHDDNHYSTAYDMALIAREAMKYDLFCQIVSATTYTIARTNIHRQRTITTKSTLLLPGSQEKPNKYYYEFATGIKTGSHSMAGYCFVGSATKEDVSLISVVFYTSNRGRWTDTKKLFEYGFSQYVSVTPIELYNMNPITIQATNYSLQDTNMGRLQLVCVAKGNQTAHITATVDEIATMVSSLRQTVLIDYTRSFAAPIQAGEVMGTMTYYPEYGEPVEYNLIASRSVGKRENAPKTLQEIIAETEADSNPFPPITIELVLIVLLPLLALWLLFIILRRMIRKIRTRNAKVPKVKSRYLK